MSLSNTLKAGLFSVAFSAGLLSISPAQANVHQSCQGGDMVTLRKTYIWINMRWMPSYDISIAHDHPLCRAEK